MADQESTQGTPSYRQVTLSALDNVAPSSNTAPSPCISCMLLAATTSPLQSASSGGSSGGDPKCKSLLEQIKRFIYSRKPPQDMKGLMQRYEELLADEHHLQWNNWTTPDPQFGSVVSHQNEFITTRNGLQNRLNSWKKNNCDDPNDPSQLPADALDWASRPAPDPIPQPRPSEDSSSSSLASKVLTILKIAGVSILLLPLVIFALADPEPATKLAAIGLTAVTIKQLMDLLGNTPEVQGEA